MKDSQGTSELCPILKSFSNKVGVLFCCHSLPNIYKRLDTELERKMMEIKRNSLGNNRFRSIDSIILKFPQIRDGLKEIRGVFEKFDEDSNGTVDHEELKKCLQKLQFHVREEDIDDLFYYCDMNENEGIQFNEFIVLLCLIYLLKDCSSSFSTTLKMELPQIDATFNTIIEVFLFLDKNGEGKLKKKDVVKALNEASPREKSPSYITRDRFKEMDLDRNGKISFREFLFAFIKWVGIDSDDDDDDGLEIQN
ncbi:probable calcium-binding CML22 isoform X1 [Olea europaea subsp. europaea]|uniref:Probable calcium-binding CML22 isoform X1 n=1 Tax=Olea europaea subsp. europaea TaxID=158383 RepID=A0A8S0UNS9_OLEEU|nr:probable calcium-binding CML22 isoform X1 [Olea europaea subsp. europaea]